MISQVPLETDKCACIVSVVVASDVAAVVWRCHCCCCWQNLLRFYVQPPFFSPGPPHSHLLANKREEDREPSVNDNDASTDNAPNAFYCCHRNRNRNRSPFLLGSCQYCSILAKKHQDIGGGRTSSFPLECIPPLQL